MSLLSSAKSAGMFRDMSENEIETVISCTGAVVCRYENGELIEKPGDKFKRLGIVLSGSAAVAWLDDEGNRLILDVVRRGGIFGLAASLVNLRGDKGGDGDSYIYAQGDCEALMLDAGRLLAPCQKNCAAHMKLMRNALCELSVKNMTLIRKTTHLCEKTLRRKIMSYLTVEAAGRKNSEFTIPMNRQELAEYLAADRSALSAELSRMAKDGLIEYRKNRFIIKKYE